MKNFSFFFLIVFLSIEINAQIYVSPSGNDNNSGTIDQPLKTLAKAMTLVDADSLIYMRGGVYDVTSTINTNKNGTDGKYIKVWNYPGETPILDFSGQSYSSSSRGIALKSNYWYFKGLVIRNTGDNGINITGWYNIVENCTIYHCKDTGLQINGSGSYNYIHNCDSFENYDPATHGGNADGFAPKQGTGLGNVFRGCRAWGNADDGWDMYEQQGTVVLDSCWSFHNGYNIWGDTAFEGNGNGFKLGGNKTGENIATYHRVTNCIAFDNKSKGFDQNNNKGGVSIINCTSYRNYRDYSFPIAPQSGTDSLINNISYNSANSLSIEAFAVQITNSWNGFTVSSSDFLSVDTSLAKSPRSADSSISNGDLFRLVSGSSLVDAGTYIGIPYNGSAPDIGAFESGNPTSVENAANTPIKFKLEQNYPNPFNPSTIIQFDIPVTGNYSLKVYNILGQEISTLLNGEISAGSKKIIFNASNLPSGVYIYRLIGSGFSISKKMILTK